MSRLGLTHLVRRYADFTAVDDVSLEIADGEFVTLLGPSGCGKTTTLRMVAGFITPDSGDIHFDKRRMNDVPPHKRNTAMVFQSYALFPHMTVAENIAFGLRMRKLGGAEQAARIDEALHMVSLNGLEGRRPGELSGGQQQRVALARAIVTRPDILLFDEPLSNLDAKLREKVRVEIRELQKRLRITCLYVTHDQAEALAISDRVVVMNRGRIEQVGAPDAIYRLPKSEFVADFLGAANVVAATALGGSAFASSLGRLTAGGARAREGDKVKLAWRPEDMKIAGAGKAYNRIDARIKSVVFRGNFIELVAQAANISFKAQVSNDSSIKEGDSVVFAVPEERLKVVE